jgi:hypothetical protein
MDNTFKDTPKDEYLEAIGYRQILVGLLLKMSWVVMLNPLASG